MNANQIIMPEAFRRPIAKQRAARFTGPIARKKAKARVEQAFLLRWDGPVLETEVRFHPVRKWRFDYAHQASKVAVEIEGGIFNRGAHVRPRGIADDIDKYNEAQALGWRVYRLCDLSDVDEVINQVKAAIARNTL